MEVKELQKNIVQFVNRWNKLRNFTPTVNEAFLHLVEEVGELATQYVNRESRKEKYDESEVKNAIGDSLMQLVMLAELHGFSVEGLITEIIKQEELILQQREKK